MRYLGIDYGEKRVGLALSDAGGRIAFPYKTIPNTHALANGIKKITEAEGAEVIVIGLPIPFSGGESKQTLVVKKFAASVKKEIAVPVEFENEIYTTALAARSGTAQKHLDAASAALILQSYLDKLQAGNQKAADTG